MKLDCPHCGDAFTYDPVAGGQVVRCRHCGLPIQLPTPDQLPPAKLQELQAEQQAAVRKEQRRAERAQKKAESQRGREEQAARENARATEAAIIPPPVPTISTVPTIVACPDCGHEVSRQAAACPGCGRPMAAQTIEKTSKTFKAMQLIGYPLAVAGLLIVVASDSAWRTAGGVAAMWGGVIITIVGLVIGVLGGVLSWWYHG